MSIPPKLRQFAVAASTQFAAFSVGGATTYPTLLLEQFQANEESSQLDINVKSWIGSIHGLAGAASILMPIIAQKIGRKFGFMISCLFLIIGWILAYTANTAAQILTSESFLGLGSNSLIIISYMCLSEMLAPKYRHVSMQLYSVILHLGMTTGGILGRYVNYKTVSLVMVSSICTSLAITALWLESPYWLACRGKFEKGKENFLKLRGEDNDSLKELKEMIAAQTENLNHMRVRKKINLRRLWTNISSRDFYVSTLHTLLLLSLYFWSGSSVILIYFIDIVRTTIHNENVTHYAGIALYAVSFTGSIVTTFLVATLKNKTIILFNACGAIVCLFGAFVATGLQSLGILSKDSYFLIYCMLGFNACNGLAAVYFMASEIIPVRHRNIGGALYTIYICSLSTVTLQLAPYMFLYIGFSGTFLFFSISALVSTLLIWKYVPETKGRTLQELEDFYMFGRFIQRNDESVEIPINRDDYHR